MGEFRIERYSASHKLSWNHLNSKSKNGLFLFDRNFMDYHSDRFHDHSVLIFNNDELVAIFPANEKDGVIYSHQGLTFGGVVYKIAQKSIEVKNIIRAITDYFRSCGFVQMVLKPVPHFLCSYPSEELLYFLHMEGAKLVRRDLSSLIILNELPSFSKGRKWIIGKGKKNGIIIKKTDDWADFFEILVTALSAHNVKPVHTLKELLHLSSKFPDNIKLYGAYAEDMILAGAVTFSYGNTLHTQYMANSILGRESGALDLLLNDLIEAAKTSLMKQLSFGVSTEELGTVVNFGLLAQKESYGARGVLHDWYILNL